MRRMFPKALMASFTLSLAADYLAVPNWEFGVDLSHAFAGYEADSSPLAGTSLLALARYVQPLGEDVSAYAGLGLGGIFVDYSDPPFPGDDGDGVMAGGMIAIGMRLDVAARGALFAEYHHAGIFDDLEVGPSDIKVEYKRSAILLGYRMTFRGPRPTKTAPGAPSGARTLCGTLPAKTASLMRQPNLACPKGRCR